MFNGVGRHVREDGTEEDEVEALVRERKPVRGSRHAPVRVVGAARQIRAMESEGGVPSSDGPLAPRDGLRVNLDTIVAAVQIAEEAEREIANAGSDIQNAVLRPKAATDELPPCAFARAGEHPRAPRSVIPDTQVRWR